MSWVLESTRYNVIILTNPHNRIVAKKTSDIIIGAGLDETRKDIVKNNTPVSGK